MKHNKLQILPVVLALWLLISAVPITAFAELLDMTTQPSLDEIVYVVAEDNTKRTEFVKHYYCSDGTFVAVTYPEAVHYQNELGEWVDVDMRLESDSAAQVYEGQNGNFKTTFSKPQTDSDASIMSVGGTPATVPAVSMQSGEYSLSWSLTGIKTAGASVSMYGLNTAPSTGNTVLYASTETEVEVKGGLKTEQVAFSVSKIPVTDPDAFALPSASNQVLYENIFGEDQNVSVRYSVSMNRIEEDILITAPTEMTSFSMQIECGALTPALNADNSVDFLDNSGEMVYHISTPYLADAAFAISYDVAVTLSEQDGTCIITYTPDTEWMNDPERIYPIILDPAVTTNDYTSAIMDTYVVENDSSGYYTSQFLSFNPMNQNDRIAIIGIQNLPEIDGAMPIISAKLCVKSTTTQATSSQVTLSTVQEGFEILTGTYNTLMPYMINSETIATATLGMFMEFDITQSISDLYSGTIGNTFAIHCATDGSSALVFPIHSMESSDTAARPCMTITYGYHLPTGLVTGDQLTIQNVGSQGYLYPNSALPGSGNYILHAPGTTQENLRTFVLKRNTSSGAYNLELSPYTEDSNVFVSANTDSKLVQLKNASEASSTVKQDWLIVPYGISNFKIVLASDMKYVMTAIGTPTTYVSTPSSATEGCVTISLSSKIPLESQLWQIYEDGAPIYGISMTQPPLETGVYYINNKETGRFISYNDTFDSLGAISGKVADIGDMIAWKITKLPDGYYTIQNADNLTEFLSVLLGTVTMATCGEAIPDAFKWRIEETTEYFYLKNIGANKYLYAITDEISSYPFGLLSNNTSSACGWRIIALSEYVELTEQSTFNDLALAVNDSKYPVVNKIPQDASWASFSDFDYTIVDNSDCVVYNSLTQLFVGLESGWATIAATHKVTAQTFTFYIYVGYESADIAAIAFATEIYATSLYIRHEYATMIYKVNYGGAMLYYYTPPVSGSPHGVDLPINLVPTNGIMVAYSHTHPNSNVFSQQDINVAIGLQIDGYVNGPDLKVRKIKYNTGEIVDVGEISPTPLTEDEKELLYDMFYDSWQNHINNDSCGFNCDSITWPTSS